MPLIKVVDFGIYTDIPTLEQVRQMYDDGVRGAIIGLCHGTSFNHKAGAQLDACASRLMVAGYSFVAYPGGYNPRVSVSQSKALIGDERWRKLKFLAIDLEHSVNAWGNPQDVMNEAISETIFNEKRAIIYSAKWAWDRFYPLARLPNEYGWFANYNDQETLVQPYPFGGITKWIGHQYKGSTLYKGLNVDLNVFDEEFFRGGVTTMPTPDDYLNAIKVTSEATSALAKKQKPPKAVSDALQYLTKLWYPS